jgi:dienelactone hydrolase
MMVTAHEKGKTIEQSGGMVMTSHMWMAPAIPAMKEIAEFDQRYWEALGPSVGSPEQMAAALAILEHPIVNSSLVDNQIIVRDAINVCVAVALDMGLVNAVVPLAKLEETRRPQEPKKPYPYKDEEVSFENKAAGITLAGALTAPETGSPFPAVVLITGSGPENRDEEVFGHKPFLVLADDLTRQGIAVLRCDDRGVGKSGGDSKTATTADLATDALAAFQYLQNRKDIDTKHIGLIGHSEGGVIAPIVANEAPDVAFVVLMAGTGVPGDSVLMLQSWLVAKAEGASDSTLKKSAVAQRALLNLAKSNLDSAALTATGMPAADPLIHRELRKKWL